MWGIFYRNWCTKKSHYSISSHLIYRTIIILNFMDQYFVNLIHYRVSFFWAKFVY